MFLKKAYLLSENPQSPIIKNNYSKELQSYAAYPHKNVLVLTFHGFPGISSDWCVVWSLFFYERKGVMSENVLDTLNMAFSHVENVLRRFENNFHTQKWEFVRNFELGSELKFSKSTKTYSFWLFVIFQAYLLIGVSYVAYFLRA